MSAKYVALIVAAVLLSACETTSDTSSVTAPGKRSVVRGAVVADDAERPSRSTKLQKARVKKPAVTRTAAATPAHASSHEMDPIVTPSTPSSGSGGGGTPVTDPPAGTSADAGVTPPSTTALSSETPGDVTTTPLAPVEPAPTITAEPAGGSAPTPTPSPFAIDFRDMLNTTVAGFPLWLMVVVGIVLAGALVFGTGGRREQPRDDRDYEDRNYAEREPHYDDRREPEPEPA
jgi:hypothetical protein